MSSLEVIRNDLENVDDIFTIPFALGPSMSVIRPGAEGDGKQT